MSKNRNDSKKGKGAALMAQMGLGDMSSMENEIYGDLENDDELERELALLQGKDVPSRSKQEDLAHIAELDQMIASSMKDVGEDDISDVDENDEELLSELSSLAHDSGSPMKRGASPRPPEPGSGSAVQMVQERLDMYHAAQDTAKANNEGSKARRMDRGIKTLQSLLKKAQKGSPVSEDDLPPPVAIPSKRSSQPPQPVSSEPPPQPASPASITPPAPVISPPAPATTPPAAAAALPESTPTPMDVSSEASPSNEQRQLLVMRRDQYKLAARNAKHEGNMPQALSYMKTVKHCESVLQAVDGGQSFDLSQVPPPPGEATASPAQRESMQASSSQSTPEGAVGGQEEEEDLPETQEEDRVKLYKAPTEAGSALEAMQQRLDKYKTSGEQAKSEGNNSKARRFGRIVKQYEDAIKKYKAGKAIDFEELPCPPGFPPIPVSSSPAKVASPTPSPKPQSNAPKPQSVAPPAGQTTPNRTVSRESVKKSPQSRAEQQALFLEERQLKFRQAALQAKKRGDMELAKKYLRTAKGFDQMILAAHSGLPVDLSQAPVPPGMKMGDLSKNSPIPGSGDRDEEDEEAPSGDRNQMYKRLEQELIAQIKTCTTNADHFTQLGDVSTASKFDKMGQNSRKDLDALRNAFKHEDPVPRFHYETKEFSVVQCCTDLGDNDLELVIIRGINYGLPSGYAPKDLDTYIKWEFPFPSDEPQKGETDTNKHTNNPEYEQTFKLQINRKSRAFLRLLKSSKTVKFDIYYKRGFFKGDKLLGSITMKLLPLESKCVIHDTYDLMDGRKSVGGKLEVKIRVRNPFVTKQVESMKEKWLIIDKFERAHRAQEAARPIATSNSSENISVTYQSMEVLKYEKQLLDKQIERMAGRLTPSQEQTLKYNSQLLADKIAQTKASIKAGGMPALKGYLEAIERSSGGYLQEAQALVKQGQRDKAQVQMNKKSLVEREAESIRARISKS